MRIGVCIPCHYEYFIYIGRVLESIERQTYKPSIVCVSLSGAPRNHGTNIDKFFSFPLAIIKTTEKKNAGENRNIAAKCIYTDVDVITFFDADDYMHPQRLESIYNAFTNNDCEVFLHMLKWLPKSTSTDIIRETIENITVTGHISGNLICNFYVDAISDIDNTTSLIIANGHATIRSYIFGDNVYPENSVGCEDSEYMANLFRRGYKFKYTTDILAIYCQYQ